MSTVLPLHPTTAGNLPTNAQGYVMIVDQQLQITDLCQLIRWLAMPYGDNAPIFATELPDGRPLDTGKKLSELYRQVVGEKRPTPGAWVQCVTCRSWYVKHPDSDRNWNDHDVHEAAKAVKDRLGR